MNYVIAVFLSRSETLSFVNALRNMGISAIVVQTPKEAGRTCGLSAKFSYENFSEVKIFISRMRFMSFQGFYLQQNDCGQTSVIR